MTSHEYIPIVPRAAATLQYLFRGEKSILTQPLEENDLQTGINRVLLKIFSRNQDWKGILTYLKRLKSSAETATDIVFTLYGTLLTLPSTSSGLME